MRPRLAALLSIPLLAVWRAAHAHAFEWTQACENPPIDHSQLGNWVQVSPVLFLVLLLSGVLLLIGGWRAIEKRMPSRRRAWASYAWMGLFALIALALAPAMLSDPTHAGLKTLIEFPHPAAGTSIVETLRQGLWSPLMRFFGPDEALMFWVSRAFAALNAGLIALLAAAFWRSRAAGLVALLLLVFSSQYLETAASDIPAQTALFLLLAPLFALQSGLNDPTRGRALAAIPLGAAATLLLPTLAPLLIVASFSAYAARASMLRRERSQLALAAGVAFGLLIYRLAGGGYTFDTVVSARLFSLSNVSLVTLAAGVAGIVFAILHKRFAALAFGLAAIPALFTLPESPAGLTLSGAWLLLPWALALPLAAGGLVHLAQMVEPNRWLVMTLPLLVILLPNLGVVFDPPESPAWQTYRFEKDMLESLSEERAVLYRESYVGDGLATFPAFRVPKGSALCLRPRADIVRDPESHGPRYVYFGRECALQDIARNPKPGSCSRIRRLFEFENCRSAHIRLADDEQPPQLIQTLQVCRVKAARTPAK